MKRLFFISMLFSLGVACNKNEEIVTPKDSANEEKVEKIDEFQTPGDKVVTATEALTRADAILSRFQTRSTPRVVKSCEYFVAKPATRSLADTIEVAFHLINYEDNAGFAMVAADERATDIYAYSDEGELTAADFEENPGLRIYKEIATEAYQAEVRGLLPPEPWPGDDPIGPITPTPNDRPNGILVQMPDGTWYIAGISDDYSRNVNPLLITQWHQGYPYNMLCARADDGDGAGCAPIALAQLFTYHHHPISFANYYFAWNGMEQNFTVGGNPGSAIYDVASLISLIYEDANTGDWLHDLLTFPSEIFDTIQAFGYSSTHRQTFDESSMLSNLNRGLPLLMFGAKSEIYLPGAHFWIVDGYNLEDYRVTYYYNYPPYEVWSHNRIRSLTYHINWGWGGSQDGYYYLPNGIDYNHHVDVIYEISPNL